MQNLTPSVLKAATRPGNCVVPIGTTDPNLLFPRYTDFAVKGKTEQLPTGKVEIYNPGIGKYASGWSTWTEISCMTRFAGVTGLAKLDFSGYLYSLSKSGVWTERIRWGTINLGAARHAFSWGREHGTFSEGQGQVGWGSKDQYGIYFGQDDGDPQAPAGQAFVRAHCWPMTYTGKNGFFWASTDPNSATAPPDHNIIDNLAGLVHVVEVTLGAGTDPGYAMSVGVDTQWQGAERVNKPVGTQTGSSSGFHKVTNGSLVVMSTLSDAQVDANPLTIYPGWKGDEVTPPQPPQPPVDTRPKYTVNILDVDGKLMYTTRLP